MNTLENRKAYRETILTLISDPREREAVAIALEEYEKIVTGEATIPVEEKKQKLNKVAILLFHAVGRYAEHEIIKLFVDQLF